MSARNHALALFVANALVAAACASDVGTPQHDDGGRPDASFADAGFRDTSATDADAGGDVPDASPADVDSGDAGVDAPRDAALELIEVPDATPPPERPADWACDRDLRVASCPPALLDPSPAPTDPSDLLYYVNRVYGVPDDYPTPAGSTWNPCEGDGPTPVVPLVCVPSNYASASGRSLRVDAWDSAAPPAPTSTHDGLPVGFDGRVGFRALFDAARAEGGHELFVASAFRPYATQASLHESYVQREMSGGLDEAEARIVAATYSAQPGHSEHQLGTTADLTYRQDNGSIYPGLDAIMGASRAFIWATANAHRFGIVLTYDARRVAETQYVYEPWHFRYVGVSAADAMRACDLETESFLAAKYGDAPAVPWAGLPWILESDARLEGHPTLPPGARIAPGSTEVATWRVVNTGSVNWDGVTARRLDGVDTGDDEVALECTAVGATADVEVAVRAPTSEGTIEATWQLLDAGGDAFGPLLPLSLRVSSATGPSGSMAWVRIGDLSDATGGQDPGADIDAIGVRHVDGTVEWASAVSSFYATPADVAHGDPSDSLGAPDAFFAWPSVAECSVSAGYVSMGGAGALIVELPTSLVAGDELIVLEVGGCDYGGGEAIPDLVEVSYADAPEGPWSPAGSGEGPLVVAIVR